MHYTPISKVPAVRPAPVPTVLYGAEPGLAAVPVARRDPDR